MRLKNFIFTFNFFSMESPPSPEEQRVKNIEDIIVKGFFACNFPDGKVMNEYVVLDNLETRNYLISIINHRKNEKIFIDYDGVIKTQGVAPEHADDIISKILSADRKNPYKLRKDF
jgi:hypothetical protein